VVNPGHVIGVTVSSSGPPFSAVTIIGRDPIGFSQTTFESQSPEIATVTEEGMVIAVGPVPTEIVIDGSVVCSRYS
jgi:hypothetical protein